MRTLLRWSSLIGLLALLPLGTGCSSSKKVPECEVSGTVTLNGKPLREGEIAFASDDDKSIPGGGGPIIEGTFQCTVPAGKKIVRIYTRSRKPVPNTDPPVYTEGLPATYNVRSTLTAEVIPGGDNTFAFTLLGGKGKDR